MKLEVVDLVDNDDNVIGCDLRKKIIQSGVKNYRVVNIFVYNSFGKFIVPLRSSNRSLSPNCYDFSAAGFVSSGETYEEAAYKELEEELGITGVELTEIGYFKPNDLNTTSFSKLYILEYDAEINYDKEGISHIYYFTKDEILLLLKNSSKKFKSDYMQLFYWLINKYN